MILPKSHWKYTTHASHPVIPLLGTQALRVTWPPGRTTGSEVLTVPDAERGADAFSGVYTWNSVRLFEETPPALQQQTDVLLSEIIFTQTSACNLVPLS